MQIYKIIAFYLVLNYSLIVKTNFLASIATKIPQKCVSSQSN